MCLSEIFRNDKFVDTNGMTVHQKALDLLDSNTKVWFNNILISLSILELVFLVIKFT